MKTEEPMDKPVEVEVLSREWATIKPKRVIPPIQWGNPMTWLMLPLVLLVVFGGLLWVVGHELQRRFRTRD